MNQLLLHRLAGITLSLAHLLVLNTLHAQVNPATSSAAEDSGEFVSAEVLTDSGWDQLIPAGKEVDAVLGDFVFQNAHIRAVLAQPLATRNANMTVREVGGCLIDLTDRTSESDQLSAFYPGRRRHRFTQHVITGSPNAIVMHAAPSEMLPEHSVTWSLAKNSPALSVVSSWKNTGTAPLTLVLEDDLRADAGKEDMLKCPDGTTDLFWFHDIHWKQAYGIRPLDGFRIQCSSNPRETVLKYERTEAQPIVLMPGESFSLRREIMVARDLPSLMALDDQLCGRSSSLVPSTLRVIDAAGAPVAGARILLTAAEQNRGTTVTNTNGESQLLLPAGALKARVQVDGQSFPEQDLSRSGEASPLTITLPDYRQGYVHVTVTDQSNSPIPAKVQFSGNAPEKSGTTAPRPAATGKTPTPDWGPETGDFFVRNVAYTASGTCTARVASGDYDVIVSRGPEYNAVFTKVHVEPGGTAELNVRLDRVIDTTGWISADFHSHSSPSGDNTSSQLGRVLNLAAEHVEFAPCTEHNRISSYAEHIRRLGLEQFLASVSGIELTGKPLPLNHQNAFPLIMKPRTQDGGAPVPDENPETQMERLAAWDNNSEKLIQQNHPDLGWLFFDRDGDLKRDEGYSRSFGIMNVMEVHPIDPLLNPTQFEFYQGKPTGNLTAMNWLQLLNQGYRVWGVVGTDAHNNFHGSGGLRIWIQSASDDPASVQTDAIRDAARDGRIVMSNGPYLTAQFQETGSSSPAVVSGQDLRVTKNSITADVRVQCPNWLDIDLVTVLVNGRRRPDLTFTRDTHPSYFSQDPVRFSQKLNFSVPEDSHLVVLAGHRTATLGDVAGATFWGQQHPVAVTNPVFVDVDGDGFKANKDMLDFPLPVKFVAEK